MIIHVHQSIHIHTLRVNGISNSSFLQVGTAGMIRSLSNNYNTGGFTGPAPDTPTTSSGPTLEEGPGSSTGAGPGTATGTASSPASGAQGPFVPFPSINS